MTYHPTDANDDGVVEADVDANSVTSQSAMTVAGTALSGTEDIDNISGIGGGSGLPEYMHIAADYSGSDERARLVNAIAAADAEDVIWLEPGNVTGSAIDIGKSMTLIGGHIANSYELASGINVVDNSSNSNRVRIEKAWVSGDVTFEDFRCRVIDCSLTGSTITFQGDGNMVYGCRAGTVTFASGTSGSVVDACSGVTVNDNGTNTVGTNG